jgi:hypothetical protein
MRSFFLVLVVITAIAGSACEPVKMPYEMPGPVGCGKRDPRQSGPSMLSVAQQTTLKNQGTPGELIDNDKGGKTWVYLRQTGSVFGESETAEMFVFDDKGLLVEQKTDIRKQVGK